MKSSASRLRHPLVRFIGAFVLLMGLFYLLAATRSYDQWVFEPYVEWSAEASAGLLRWIGYREVTVRGASLTSPRVNLEIDRGCDGIEPTALFLALILAFPAPFRRKLPALVLGIPLLVGVNLARVASLYLVGLHYPRLFHVMHVDVWQMLFILVAITIWAGWLQWATGALSRRPAPA